MASPKVNDIVIFSMIGRLDNGEVFIAIDKEKPFKITVGNAEIPPSVESEIQEMEVGETRVIRVPPEEGYGHRHKYLLQEIENPQLIESIKPRPGMIVQLKVNKDGEEQTVPATIMEVKGSKLTVDYNHPLAGHHLNYELTLLEIVSPE